MKVPKNTLLTLFLVIPCFVSYGQSFHFFSPEVKSEYPSVVYDFLERYLYVIDSLEMSGKQVDRKLLDDKVLLTNGSITNAQLISPKTTFNIKAINESYYDVEWEDSLGNKLLGLVFPMQYELLLGKPKIEIEKDFKIELTKNRNYIPKSLSIEELVMSPDGYLVNRSISHYYVEDLNTKMYFAPEKFSPVFDLDNICYSAANLFHGCIEGVKDYTLFIEQHLYGFSSEKYSVSMEQWLSYCQEMNLVTYFAIEEEYEDCLKALLIAQNKDLGFNHMLSLLIPKSIITDRTSVIKGKLNAFIPSHNVKDLFQKYVEKENRTKW